MFKRFEFICTNLLFILLLMAPASAQFEVSPDHLENEKSQAAAASPAELQAQIKEAQAHLLDYQAQLKAKSESMEEARQQAISAGIQGDGAGVYLDACEQQRKEFELLEKSLSASIEAAQNTINGLQAQLTLIATRKDSPQAHPIPRIKSKTPIVAQKTMF
jgi:chromosome segregation ATPase